MLIWILKVAGALTHDCSWSSIFPSGQGPHVQLPVYKLGESEFKMSPNFARIYNLKGLFNHGIICQSDVVLSINCRRINLNILFLNVSGFELGEYLKLTNKV